MGPFKGDKEHNSFGLSKVYLERILTAVSWNIRNMELTFLQYDKKEFVMDV